MNSAFELKSAGYWGGGWVGIKCCIQTTIWTQSSTLNLNREPLIEGVIYGMNAHVCGALWGHQYLHVYWLHTCRFSSHHYSPT